MIFTDHDTIIVLDTLIPIITNTRSIQYKSSIFFEHQLGNYV